ERVAAVDTNVRRVLARWEGRPLDGAELRGAADAHLPDDAATWNQAVMELGAVVCRPTSPRCAVCPVTSWCADPTVYVAPPRQAPFEGSDRQVRGGIVRTLCSGPRTVDELAAVLDEEPTRVTANLTALTNDGLVVRSGRRYALPG
ncbi:MAG: A/G-specific adenine glycosylase, partial [Acidimicrobiia bacterium]|nr:A/G-specific adenine glycosylase [Acidimicrobiia bacterium]